jgi:hypothetical protein
LSRQPASRRSEATGPPVALTIAGARAWDLYISRAIRDGEPPEFNEPGLFLTKPDGTLFFAARGIDVATERKMPARGEA